MITKRDYAAWIRTAIGHARYWLGKMGLDAEQRRLFWLALAEQERREGHKKVGSCG